MYFLDTGYFRGIMDKTDDNHEEALKIQDFLEGENETCVINTTVVVETLNRAGGKKEDIENLYDSLEANHKVISLTKQDYLKSLEINGWYDNSINFSDCTIIKTMMDLQIHKIVSFDSDFTKIVSFHVISSI